MPLKKEPVKKWKQPVGPKPIQRKNKNTIGLGKAIQNARSKENAIEYLPDGEMRFTVDKHEANWVKLRSVTQESSLDAFLSTAELAEKDFTADRHSNVKIIRMDAGADVATSHGIMLSNQQRAALNEKQRAHSAELIVPRRPYWDEEMTRFELERQEKEAFLNWRRKLATLQEENDDLLLTPFERNIEVWRQLWRVVERSDLVVQIVDARDPLLFRSTDLEEYVKELDERKQNLLLVNKADLLTTKQRIIWAKYFIAKGIAFTFFSARRANELLELQKELGEDYVQREEQDEPVAMVDGETVDAEVLERIRILKIEELEDLFLSKAPSEPLQEPRPGHEPLIQIGLVGYPNVGKSSTINALVGAKKVSVSSTPGKTKHFQTIKLSDRVMLCDCPGLVFPNFAYNKGELVCNGVLPIDQLRDYIGPSTLVAERIPKYFLEAVYGIHIETRSEEEGGGEHPSAQELLVAYARARGYMTQGFGSADEPRAARYILKDYVNGKLLYINPPPHLEDDTPYTREECKEFNKALYTLQNLPESRREQLLEAAKNKGITSLDLARDLSKLTFSSHIGGDSLTQAKSVTHGGKQAALYNAAKDLDREFFQLNGIQGKLTKPFHQANAQQGNGKKHNKKNKKGKKKAAMFSD
ncbi:AFL042Cp [Eremothecium gossypii ATCC 10895]|uniref:AFL042Cp n=1 Tax=Eremothecium gossypii (strain ATCC 10895 / CBS 109.51 / FGSC 9923 / NRRL Y-1056) TaxID=284811 RepID=Q754V9_EREGS|nr:AFL042Cp [Eremothecium gossypii ATCC 10895]AAS53330.2 AFL042Cp [Eremothecium gossypii ATCC 10895]AEY97641.1 FAFL042Cp [Eremothecium gossypii FDAG1]